MNGVQGVAGSSRGAGEAFRDAAQMLAAETGEDRRRRLALNPAVPTREFHPGDFSGQSERLWAGRIPLDLTAQGSTVEGQEVNLRATDEVFAEHGVTDCERAFEMPIRPERDVGSSAEAPWRNAL